MMRGQHARGDVSTRSGPRALLVALLLTSTGCAGLLGTGTSAGAPASSAPASRATVRDRQDVAVHPNEVGAAVPLPYEPIDAEPTPAASDSAGVARLIRLAQVWHTVALHHPWVATRGVPWDSALIIAALRVRSATDDAALADAYQRFFRVLRDPMTRVVATRAEQPPTPVTIERTDDSVLAIRIAPNAAFTVADSTLVAQALETVPSRVLLDLRGGSATANDTDDALPGARLEGFLSRTGLATALYRGTLTAPWQRTRRIGITLATDAAPAFRDGWQESDARSYAGRDTANRRVILLADSATVFASALLAMHDAARAIIVADGSLRDAAPVSRARVRISPTLSAVVRVGELVHADGTVDIVPDTVIQRSASSSSDEAKQSALSMLRATASLPLAARPLQSVVPPARAPVFYDTTAHPFMGARLLGGFRLWSAMRARHASRDLYDDDLDAVFERVVPRLEAARTDVEYARALSDLAATLDDAEGTLNGASYEAVIGVAAFPFRVRNAEGRVFVTDVVRDSVILRVAIVPGTEIIAVDGYPVNAWLSDHRRVSPAANDWSRVRHQMQHITRGQPGDVVVKVRDANNRERTTSVPRRAEYRNAFAAWERPEGSGIRTLSEGVSYVDVERLTNSSADALLSSITGARAVVFDLRGRLNVADSLLLRRIATRPNTVAGRLVQRTLTAPCFASIREAIVACPDVRETRPWSRAIDTNAVIGARIVALIDERTQGAMERFALSLEQMTNVVFVGSSTAGSISATVPLSLPGGLTVGIATEELRRNDGGQIQRVGITPTIDLRPSARGLRIGDDEMLMRAHQWVQQQLEPPRRRR